VGQEDRARRFVNFGGTVKTEHKLQGAQILPPNEDKIGDAGYEQGLIVLVLTKAKREERKSGQHRPSSDQCEHHWHPSIIKLYRG